MLPRTFVNYFAIMKNILFRLFCSFTCLFVFALVPAVAQKVPKVTVKPIEYHGWKDALVISNGKVEAIVVPSIGRVMQFRFVGEEGVFWENSDVAGKAVNPEAKDWINFGGDKSWPAPQSDWPKITPRAWPPPAGFDASNWEAEIIPCADTKGLILCPLNNENAHFFAVRLRSPVDPNYGIRVTRTIFIIPSSFKLGVQTFFEKVSGNPFKVGVWVITQMNEGEMIFVPVPKNSQYQEGYNKQSKELPEFFKVENGLIALKRDAKKSTKIGNDAGSLLWVGQKHILKIDSEREANAEYPDNGSSAEMYTNADPLKYVELEMLGALKEMKVGDKISRTNTYTLLRRSEKLPEAEARKIFAANKPKR